MSRREIIEAALLVFFTLAGLVTMISIAHVLASALAWMFVAVQGW